MNFKWVASSISARLSLMAKLIYTGCGVKVALHFWEVAEPFKSDILYHRLARPQCALRERMDSSAKLPPAHMRYVACHLNSQYNTKKTKVSSI